jgi:hypothetical protein
MGRALPFWKLIGAVCLALAIFSALACPAYARLIRVPGYDELFAKSDLVILARPVTKTTDTKERTFFPDIVQAGQDGKPHRVEAIGVETRFQIIRTIKGRPSHNQFVLHHLREPESNREINGPGLVSFDPSDEATQRNILLFLVKEKDGRYAPYSGQTDPDFSIFALHPATIERIPRGGR